jgi:hypothetical protein
MPRYILSTVCALAMSSLLLTACSKNEEPAAPPAAAMPMPPANASAPIVEPPAPVASPSAPSDAVALSEEEIDKINVEKSELASRATDLESQLEDGKALIALKEKQIKELEEKLKGQK